MSVTRRSALQGALLVVAALSAGSRRVLATPAPALLVYDSRSPQSRALRQRHLGPAVDLRSEHANFWRTLRSGAPPERIVGLCSWSDLVQVRGLLQERGLRLREETRQGQLYYWEMTSDPALSGIRA